MLIRLTGKDSALYQLTASTLHREGTPRLMGSSIQYIEYMELDIRMDGGETNTTQQWSDD
jgi:hypothetical protein